MNAIALTILGMFGLSEVILILILPIIFILLIRLLGAWMLRINEVIRLQKEILEELKKRN